VIKSIVQRAALQYAPIISHGLELIVTTSRQSVSWWCFVPNLLTPEVLVRAAADIGYAAIELVTQPYWQLIRDHGLQIASIQGHGTIVDGLNRRENKARITDELRANLELASKWGIPNLICFSGSRAGLDDAIGAEITAENLRHVAKMAEDAGVTLVLELLNSKVDHPDYQCDYTAWGVQVCEMVNSPRVKLLYDIYHMQIMEGDIIRTIQTQHQHFAHYHTAGNPGRHEIDASQELNYPAIMRAIAETGYTGYVGQEFIPTGDPIAGLKAAFELCKVELV
jgi:hydroxypyruvate isomerase